MKTNALWITLCIVVLSSAVLAACGSDPADTPGVSGITLSAPPISTPTGAAVATPEPGSTSQAATVATPGDTPSPTDPPLPLNADDLDHLPDDPTELMYATLDQSLLDIGRKMAYSHNDAFIPVLMEFMRFQTDEESLLTLASYVVRIRDKIPEEEFAFVPEGQQSWDWWVRWLAENPEVNGPEGYDGWKGRMFGFIDERMGQFMYDGVPSNIRLEEIVWGGVLRDGIPDLQFPDVLAAEDARYLDPGDRVFGVSINGEHRAYPLRVLNPHEMANDTLGGVQFALAY